MSRIIPRSLAAGVAGLRPSLPRFATKTPRTIPSNSTTAKNITKRSQFRNLAKQGTNDPKKPCTKKTSRDEPISQPSNHYPMDADCLLRTLGHKPNAILAFTNTPHDRCGSQSKTHNIRTRSHGHILLAIDSESHRSRTDVRLCWLPESPGPFWNSASTQQTTPGPTARKRNWHSRGFLESTRLEPTCVALTDVLCGGMGERLCRNPILLFRFVGSFLYGSRRGRTVEG